MNELPLDPAKRAQVIALHVHNRAILLEANPIKPLMEVGNRALYDLEHARQIHARLLYKLSPEAGVVQPGRGAQALKAFNAWNVDRSIDVTVRRQENARQLAMHLEMCRRAAPFREFQFEVQLLQMRQLLKSRGLELEMTNRVLLDLRNTLSAGNSTMAILDKSLVVTSPLLEYHGVSRDRALSLGYQLAQHEQAELKLGHVEHMREIQQRAMEVDRENRLGQMRSLGLDGRPMEGPRTYINSAEDYQRIMSGIKGTNVPTAELIVRDQAKWDAMSPEQQQKKIELDRARSQTQSEEAKKRRGPRKSL